MSDTPDVTPTEQPAPPPPRHCWHKSARQHTHIKLHADIRCCHCGEDRCVSLKEVPPKGHGPHAHSAEWRAVPVEPISVAGCEGAKPDSTS